MRRLCIYPALLATLLVLGPVHAEDIDLFVDSPTTSVDPPNVLFIIDNTANWSQTSGGVTKYAAEVAALVSIFTNLSVNSDGTAKFNVGVMFAAETGTPNNNVDGGYVRAAIRSMNSTTKDLYAAMFNSLDENKDKGNGGKSSLVMAEAYRYFAGDAPYAGTGKAKADYTGNSTSGWANTYSSSSSRTAMQAIYNLSGNALSSSNAANYTPPPLGSGCAKNFIIYISNGAPQDNSSVTTLATSMLSSANGDTTPIPVSPTGSQSNVSDEWSRFMKQALDVTTYTIDVIPGTSGQGPGWTALLKSMASVSEGKYKAVNSLSEAGTEITLVINDILSEIQAVNSVFASVSLPVSVNTQGTYLNQVYVGMFRPDQDAYPRWTGNLKQYKLGLSGTMLQLQDADGDSAINNQTGFITECARSFWTPTTVDDYWDFKPQGGCIGVDQDETNDFTGSNFPDGNVVEKGAQGYLLRSSVSRTVKTCSPTFSACTTLTNFDINNTDITEGLLGAASATERNQLINWAHGLDVDNENINAVTTGEMRPSVHGDVVHSRPVAINFGTDSSPKVVVFYGGNDGALRAINGNRSQNIGSGSDAVAPGQELWSFIPPEFYGHIKRLRDNTTQISFPNITTGNPLPKPYGFDGAITAHVDTGITWLYATMRRGGRAVYAFDVNTSDPTNFSLKWKVGCPNNFPVSGTVDDTDCGSFDDLGQTWSAPRALKASGYGSGASPLLIMGGGYDTCEDADPNTCTSSSKGNKIYVLDADTGALVKTFDTDRSVVADVMVVPDSAGLARYAYAADLGGNLYRIEIGSDTPANWTSTKIASLGCPDTTSCSQNRKFMFAPDILEDNGEYLLLLGSGDREKPRNYTNPVQNYFFMVKDKPTDDNWLSTENATCADDVICLDSLLFIGASASDPAPSALANKKGWYLEMAAGEQVVTAAITIFGTVTFSTHQPSVATAGSCTSDLGTARVYNVNYSNAASTNGTNNRSEVLPGDVGLPPSPVGGMVTLDTGQTVPFCIGCSSDSPLEAEQPPIPPGSVPTQPKRRVYWYIQR